MKLLFLLSFSLCFAGLPTWILSDGTWEINSYNVKSSSNEKTTNKSCLISSFSLSKKQLNLKWVKAPMRSSGRFIQQNFQMWNPQSPVEQSNVVSYFKPDSQLTSLLQLANRGSAFWARNEYLDLQTRPYLNVHSTQYSNREYSWSKSDVYTIEMLFQLTRHQVLHKIPTKEIHLLQGITPDGSFSLVWAKIQIENQVIPLKMNKDIPTQLVSVTLADEKKAEFYISLDGSFRVIKAFLFDKSQYELISSTRDSKF